MGVSFGAILNHTLLPLTESLVMIIELDQFGVGEVMGVGERFLAMSDGMT